MRDGRNEGNGPSAQTREIPAAKQESPQPAKEGRVGLPRRRVKPDHHKQPRKEGVLPTASQHTAPERQWEAISQKITGKQFPSKTQGGFLSEKRDLLRALHGALVRMTYNKADCNGISCARTTLYGVRWLGEAAGRPLALRVDALRSSSDSTDRTRYARRPHR